MKKTVSVIIPVYNVESFLIRCVKTVAEQDFDDLEILLIDDGSTDKSGEICDKLAESDSRISVIHKENGGLSSARNCGIDNAVGEYLMFVDSDDYIERDMISKLYGTLSAMGGEMAVCGINNIYEDGSENEKLNSENPIKERCMSKREFCGALVRSGGWYYITACNKLYKKELFDGLRFREQKLHEDEFIVHHIAWRCNKIACISERLYNYVSRRESITKSVYSPKRLDAIEAMLEREELYISEDEKELAVKNLMALINEIWNTYKKADLSNETYRVRYSEFYKLCRRNTRKVLRFNMSLKYRVFFVLNFISVKFTYKILG